MALSVPSSGPSPLRPKHIPCLEIRGCSAFPSVLLERELMQEFTWACVLGTESEAALKCRSSSQWLPSPLQAEDVDMSPSLSVGMRRHPVACVTTCCSHRPPWPTWGAGSSYPEQRDWGRVGRCSVSRGIWGAGDSWMGMGGQ